MNTTDTATFYRSRFAEYCQTVLDEMTKDGLDEMSLSLNDLRTLRKIKGAVAAGDISGADMCHVSFEFLGDILHLKKIIASNA